MKKRGKNEFNEVPSSNPSPTNFDAINAPELGDAALKNDAPLVNDSEGDEYFSDGPQKRGAKAGSSAAKLTAIMTSSAAVIIFGGSLLTGVSKPDVRVNDVWADYYNVGYSVSVSDEDCKIELSNYFELHVQDLQKGENVGTFDNLTPNMEYTLTVYKKSGLGGKTKLEEQTISTSPTSPAKVTKLNGVETECKCAVDGYFYFSMDLVDENGYYSNFRAVLTDFEGNAREISFDDPNRARRILVRGGTSPFFGGKDRPATLEIFCTTAEHGENKQITLYKNEYIII